MNKFDVIIIGAGLMGASAAIFLAQRRQRVCLIDADRVASKASAVNFGGVRRQGRSLEQLPLSMRAHHWWQTLDDWLGIDIEYLKSGHLKFARDDNDMDLLTHYWQQTQGFNLGIRLLTQAQMRVHYPWVNPQLAGASFCPDDGQANPRLAAPAFVRKAESLGVTVIECDAVTGLDPNHEAITVTTRSGRQWCASVVINSAGAWGGQLASMLGEPTPETSIYPLMMVTEPLPMFMTVSTGIQGGAVYARQVARGNCVIGGGRGVAIDADFARTERHGMMRLMRHACDLFPVLRGKHIIRYWTGVEGSFSDGHPVLSPSAKHLGIFHAFGFSGAGFQLAPAVGEVLADLVCHGTTSIPIDAFSIRRFEAVESL